MYSAAWDGQPVEIFETSGVQPEARGLGLAPADLLSVSLAGELAIGRDPKFPLTYFHPGRLATVALGGGAPREVADIVSAADYTPDGRELAVARVVNGESRVELPLGRVWYSGVAARDPISSLRVSPDGNSIAFWHGHLSAPVLSVVSRAGTKRDLIRQAGQGRGLAWRRDGSEIWSVIGRSADDASRLVAIRADGVGVLRDVLKLPANFRLHDLSADGDVLVTLADATTTLHVQARGSVIDRPWFNSTFLNDISRDGLFLLFMETPGLPHQPSLFYRSVDGRPPVRIAGGNMAGQSARLSFDGKRAVVLRDGKVTIVPLAGQPRELTTPSQAADMLAWDGSAQVV